MTTWPLEEKVFMPHIRHMLTEAELWWLETMSLKGVRGIQGRNNVERPWHAVYDRIREANGLMTCPCGLTEGMDCPECVADMDQPLCYLDPMIDDVRNERY